MNPSEPTPQRREEIRALLQMPAEEVMDAAGARLVVCEDEEAIYARMAEDLAGLIRAGNARGRSTRVILPVGPVGQYPLLLERVQRERLSLAACHLFYMDEYADESGRVLPPQHPLSFAGTMWRMWLGALPQGLAMPAEHIVFPSEETIEGLAARIAADGGLDACFGGIGIHGHLAFNEPEAGVAASEPRLVRLNDFTVTINAMRAHVGGNLEGFPRYAFTVGMTQILGARKLRLACRSGGGQDWAKTVLRLTLLGTPGDDYPCTYAARHPDLLVYTDRDTLACPRFVI